MDPDILEIRLLGEFALLRGGRKLAAPTQRKARLLVAHLALNPGHEFVRNDLASHLWPDSEPEAARFNLRQLIAGIRRSAPELSPYISAGDRTTIRFDGASVNVDALEFERLLDGDPEKAVDYYRAPLQESLDDTWLEGPRADLAERYMLALELLAEQAEPREAVSWLRRAIGADPFREPLQQTLMTRLAECGDLTGVEVAYRAFADLLHREMNITPSIQTEQLYRSLLAGGGPQADFHPKIPHPRSKLPVPATDVFGRKDQIRLVRHLLEDGRLVTLLGPGGVGKTRLAIAIGVEEQANRDAGVWFADFSAVRDPGRVPQELGSCLGLHELGSFGWSQVIADSIGSLDRLLIFDNCEHVVEAGAELASHLLASCSRLRILATSRTPLGCDGEQRVEVPPLELPPLDLLAKTNGATDYRSYSALLLFEARARLVSPRFELTSRNIDRLVSICSEVDGIPLGIEMAAARLGALSLEEVERRLEDKFTFLKSPSRTSTPRHKSLGSVIRWSYDLLSEDERALLRRLTVFAGGWTLAAAESICGLAGWEAGRALEAMVSLAEASLLQRRGERYFFLETVRQFARDELDQPEEVRELRSRHLDWFLTLAKESESKLRGAEQARWFKLMDEELENFRAALEWSLEGPEPAKGLRLCGALWRFWQSRGILSEGREWCARLLAMCPAGHHDAARANVLNGTGTLARDQSDYDAAYQAHAEALAIYRSLGNREGIATSLIGLGIVATQRGDFDEGWDCCEKCLEIRRAIGDRWGVASALNNLGIAAMCKLDYAAALKFHQEGMEISRGAGDRFALARSLTNMAKVAMYQGDLASAREYHEESTMIRRELGDRSGLARSLCNLGLVATYQGEYLLAVASHEESLNLGREMGDRRCVAENVQAIGTLDFERQDLERAVTLWGAAETLREAIGAPLPPYERDLHEREEVAARETLGEESFRTHLATGRSMTTDQAVALATSPDSSPSEAD